MKLCLLICTLEVLKILTEGDDAKIDIKMNLLHSYETLTLKKIHYMKIIDILYEYMFIDNFK